MRILITRNDKLGDFILALPVFKLIKAYSKEHTLIACVDRANGQLAHELSFIDEVIVDNGNAFNMSRVFRLAKIDVAVTLFSTTHIGLALLLAGVKRRIAPATKIAQIFYNERVVQRRSRVEMSEFEYNIELAKHLFTSMPTELKTPLFEFSQSEKSVAYREFQEEFGVDGSKKIVAFHVGFGGSSDANLSVDEYIRLAKTVESLKRVQTVFTFGPDEVELLEEVRKKVGESSVVLYLSKGSVAEFAHLISSFLLFVSTSTGTYHVAAASGVRTFTFFASSLFASAARWRSVSSEELQMNRMVPQEVSKRGSFLNKIEHELIEFLEVRVN